MNPAETPLRGRALRFVLVNELAKHPTMSVAEMVVMVRRYRFNLDGRESKIVSDALRWELARGRVIKLARGVYAYRTAPPTTARRIRIFAEASLGWIVAMTRFSTTTHTPPRPRNRANSGDHPPPWHNLNWLWAT